MASTDSKQANDSPTHTDQDSNLLSNLADIRHDPEKLRENFQSDVYPYKTKMKRRAYESHKRELQAELLKVQAWVKETGQKIIIICEGRDAAGKGGTIKRFMEHLNPRSARVIALEKPTDQERGQWFFQHVSSSSWPRRTLL